MADKADKPKTITVEALQAHSYNGKDYQVGDTYDIDEQLADSVAIQGKAIRTDRVAVAKKADKDAKAAAETRAKETAKTTVRTRTVGKHKK